MSPLQWALLILGALAIVALYFFSRRDRGDSLPDDETAAPPLTPSAREKQLDIFNSENQQFDEFGVGKPRKIGPQGESPEPGAAGPAPVPSPYVRTAPTMGASTAPMTARNAASEKIVSLLIAEREGTHILGTQIHRALARQGLQFGARQIYHRMHNGGTVFSVASLLKPGVLDPEQSEGFSTPGLALFMVLPGPQRPLEALQDMLGTAETLAKALNAEVYDAKRKQFTALAARTLLADVEAWARANPSA